MKELLQQRIQEVYPDGVVLLERTNQDYGTEVRGNGEEIYFPITLYTFEVTQEDKETLINAEVYTISNPRYQLVDFLEWYGDGWERLESKTYDNQLQQWVHTVAA